MQYLSSPGGKDDVIHLAAAIASVSASIRKAPEIFPFIVHALFFSFFFLSFRVLQP